MSNWVFHKPAHRLGLDIQSSEINLLEISKKHCIEAYAQCELPINAVSNGVIHDVSVVSDALKKILDTNSFFSAKKVVIAIPDCCIIQNIITIPPDIQEEEIEDYVCIEIESESNCAFGDIFFDFSILGESISRKDMLDVLVVSARSEYVYSRFEVLQAVGLSFIAVDIESFATKRAVRNLSPYVDNPFLYIPIANGLNRIDLISASKNYLLAYGLSLWKPEL